MYGIFFFVLLVILLGLHNFFVTTVIWKNKILSRKYTILPILASSWSVFFLFSFFGNIELYFILFAGHLCAVMCNLKIFTGSEDRGRLNKVILFYNVLGASVVFLRVLSGYGIDFTGFFSIISHTLTLSHSLFHMFNFSFLQIFYPTLFIPPILLNPRKSKRTLGRLVAKLVKGIAAYTILFIVLASIPAVLMISSFSGAPVFAEDYTRTPMKFGVKVNSFANEAETMGDWEILLSEEIEIAKELELDYLDIYVDRSYLQNASKYQRLEEGIRRIREEGFGVILACMGSPDWFFNPPSLKVHNTVMREDAVTLAALHPDYLILFVEPFARHNGMMLPHPLSVDEWVFIINETALKLKTIDENIKVAVAIAAAETEGLNLFQELQTSDLDAIGIDVHPFHIDMIDIVHEYSQSATPEKELWIFEFGMETYNFGEETQARYMSYLPCIASELQVTGIIQYDIMDNPQSQLGLVYSNGERKLGFYALKNAIERVRGKYSDFSEIAEEKQGDNWFFILILVLILMCVGLRRIRTHHNLPIVR